MQTLHIEIRDGVRVAARDDLRSMTAYILLEQEDWFEQEMDFVRAFIQPGMHVLDIGANHGVYSLAIARRLQGRGHVWSFEPAAAPFAMLVESVRDNRFEQWVSPLKFGISDRARSARMFVSANSELNSLHGSGSETESIRLESLDAILPWLTKGAAIDFVKLDAEGEEVSILRGGALFFAQQSPLAMFEIKHGADFNHGLCDAFSHMGYRLYRLMPGPNVLVPIDAGTPFEHYQLNLFAAKDDRAQQLEDRGLLVRTPKETHDAHVDVSWQSALENMPFAKGFMTQWKAKMGRHSAVVGQHTEALNAYLSAQDVSSPAPARVAALHSAQRIWRTSFEREPFALSIGLCLARVAQELGNRDQALKDLVNVWRGMARASSQAFTLPFLPPTHNFDQRTPQGHIMDWLMAAMVEAYESWRLFSSYFGSDTYLTLSAHMANPHITGAMRRRHALHVLRTGNPLILDEDDALLTASEDHHNIHFWRRYLSPRVQMDPRSFTPVQGMAAS